MRIILADSLALVRAGLRQSLTALAEVTSFVEADSFAALDRAVGQCRDADLVIADAALPGASGIEELTELARRTRRRLVLMFAEPDGPAAIAALAGGGAGVVLRSASEPVLCAALRVVLAGGRYLAPEMILRPNRDRDCVACARDMRPRNGAAADMISRLTPRQRDVMALMVQGHSNKEIARRLGLTEGTVKVHVTGILRSLRATSRLKAVVMARGAG